MYRYRIHRKYYGSIRPNPEYCILLFPIGVIEALAQGVPVVQPRAGGFPEVIEATEGGVLYDPHTPGALVQALESLLLNPQEAQAMGQRGRKVVLEQYSIDQMAQNVVAVYEDLQ